MNRSSQSAAPSNPHASVLHQGLTVREHFAGLALVGLLSGPAGAGTATHADLAGEAFTLADAMLAAAEKPAT